MRFSARRIRTMRAASNGNLKPVTSSKNEELTARPLDAPECKNQLRPSQGAAADRAAPQHEQGIERAKQKVNDNTANSAANRPAAVRATPHRSSPSSTGPRAFGAERRSQRMIRRLARSWIDLVSHRTGSDFWLQQLITSTSRRVPQPLAWHAPSVPQQQTVWPHVFAACAPTSGSGRPIAHAYVRQQRDAGYDAASEGRNQVVSVCIFGCNAAAGKGVRLLCGKLAKSQ